MPVLEINLLHLRPGIQPTDLNLVSNLRNIRAQLGTNSRFYISTTSDLPCLYIIGIWPTLEAHKSFLSSPDRARILGPQEEQTEFRWSVHVEAQSIEHIPLQAPFIHFSRVFAHAEGENEIGRILKERNDKARKATKPYPVFEGTSIEPEMGKEEYISCTGWSSEAAHKQFEKDMGGLEEQEQTKEVLLESEGAYLQDLEKLVFRISGS
jgi:heme-degrading monooxygenase HmoA